MPDRKLPKDVDEVVIAHGKRVLLKRGLRYQVKCYTADDPRKVKPKLVLHFFTYTYLGPDPTHPGHIRLLPIRHEQSWNPRDIADVRLSRRKRRADAA